jgi:hypothetical protein
MEIWSNAVATRGFARDRSETENGSASFKALTAFTESARPRGTNQNNTPAPKIFHARSEFVARRRFEPAARPFGAKRLAVLTILCPDKNFSRRLSRRPAAKLSARRQQGPAPRKFLLRGKKKPAKGRNCVGKPRAAINCRACEPVD